MTTTPSKASQVASWSFDEHAGRIAAFDGEGRLLMAIAANPLFGARLAAAFCSPASAPPQTGTSETWATVVELASSFRQPAVAPAPLAARDQAAA